MDHFQRRDDGLYAEDVSLDSVAASYGTPTYVYSRATLERHVHVLREGLGSVPHLICYAIKANANLAVLDVLRQAGCGFDAVSGGELARALKIGADPARIILSGVGKRDDEIEAGLRAGVAYVSVESASELGAISRIAARLGVTAPVSLRVNPNVDPQTHPYIATGLRESKFGIPVEEALGLYAQSREDPHLDPVGVTCHIGSQITELAPFADAAQIMAELADDLRRQGIPLGYVGLGGGLGIPYLGESPPSPDRYGEVLAKTLGPFGATLVLEPGRVIVGNAGILLTRVVRKKPGPERPFLVVDAGMNDLMRPALYQARHGVVPVAPTAPGDTPQAYAVVGPVCETADTFDAEAPLGECGEGDLIAIRTVGAYGFAMASNYNGRGRPAEVLVDGDQARLVRIRETDEDQWRGERGPDGTPWAED